MNACCSIVKFFVVLMNLVFWVCTWSWSNSSNPQKRFTFFREIPFFFWWAKRFFFLPFLFSPRGTQKTTPLSHQHTRPSNSNITTRSVAAVRASCWENIVVRSSQGDEDVFAAVKQFFFLISLKVISEYTGFSAQFPWNERNENTVFVSFFSTVVWKWFFFMTREFFISLRVAWTEKKTKDLKHCAKN